MAEGTGSGEHAEVIFYLRVHTSANASVNENVHIDAVLHVCVF